MFIKFLFYMCVGFILIVLCQIYNITYIIIIIYFAVGIQLKTKQYKYKNN